MTSGQTDAKRNPQLPRQPVQPGEGWEEFPPHGEGGTADLPASAAKEAADRQMIPQSHQAQGSDDPLLDAGHPPKDDGYEVGLVRATVKLSGNNGNGGNKSIELYAEAMPGRDAMWADVQREVFGHLKVAVHKAFEALDWPEGTAHIDAGKRSGGSGQASDGKVDHGYCSEHGSKFIQTENMRSPGHKIKGTDEWCNKPKAA